MKQESPCKTCDNYPCKEHKDCEKRWQYVETYKDKDYMKAADVMEATGCCRCDGGK